MPASAISRLAAITAATVSIDGVGSSPTAAKRAVERPAGDAQAVLHQADLALHRRRRRPGRATASIAAVAAASATPR